jgi:hypothetical protein
LGEFVSQSRRTGAKSASHPLDNDFMGAGFRSKQCRQTSQTFVADGPDLDSRSVSQRRHHGDYAVDRKVDERNLGAGVMEDLLWKQADRFKMLMQAVKIMFRQRIQNAISGGISVKPHQCSAPASRRVSHPIVDRAHPAVTVL